MSKYVKMNGALVYENQGAFDAAVAILKKGHWLNESGCWVEEDGSPTDLNASSPHLLTIHFPLQSYFNLTQVEKEITQECVLGVRWASNDGCFEGGIYGADKVELNQWAQDNGLEPQPEEKNYEDESEFQENVGEWEDEIMNQYLTNLSND